MENEAKTMYAPQDELGAASWKTAIHEQTNSAYITLLLRLHDVDVASENLRFD
jgi:hypothetical protein